MIDMEFVKDKVKSSPFRPFLLGLRNRYHWSNAWDIDGRSDVQCDGNVLDSDVEIEGQGNSIHIRPGARLRGLLSR